jgi:hypothetical protein
MRSALLAFTLLVAAQPAGAATAYEALRILGKQKSEALLDNTIEVRGDKGAPQPHVWKITVKDATARGGAKEFSIQATRLAGEQAAQAGGSPMNMSQLNIDSDGVHTVAEREAKKVAFAYDHASYTLRAGSKGGSPVWEIRLTDDRSGDTASLHIAATTGNILSTEGLTNRRKAVAATPALPPAPAAVAAPSPRYQPTPEERPTQPAPRGGTPGVQQTGDGFFDRVGNHFGRRGRQIGDVFHNLFTGDHRDSAGPNGSRPGPTPIPPRAKDDTDYVKPSRVRD